jgi:hypothetical protein
MLKINSDGAYLDQGKEGGWSFVIRNSWAEVVKAGASHVLFVMDVFLCSTGPIFR